MLRTYSTMSDGTAQKLAQGFVNFVNKSGSPYHAVKEVCDRLKGSGFVPLNERQSWSGSVGAGSKAFFTRNDSTVVAFAIGPKFDPSRGGVSIIAAHTDSPNLRVKPVSTKSSQGYLQVGVETYGGGLWHTWFDRDLTVAGKVVLRSTKGEEQPEIRLVHIPRPILKIPNLAIHLDRGVNENGMKVNKEKHLSPILCSEAMLSLNGEEKAVSGGVRHHPALLNAIAKQLDVDVSRIADFDLSLMDCQPATIGGLYDEFIFSPRLDNLLSSYACMEALVAGEDWENETGIRMMALFDHEEIGSVSAQGAGSSIITETMNRLKPLLFSSGNTATDAYESFVRRSFLISIDMAHAVHPNYAEKHEDLHKPLLHAGPVIKENCNQRYATNVETTYALRELARTHDIPVQDFVIRQDLACGSTIGPTLSALTGIRTIDIGNPQWGMHSIRETCGTEDLHHLLRLLNAFFKDFRSMDDALNA